MPSKEPLWKRRMKEKEGSSKATATFGILPFGTSVRLKSGTQGWVKGTIVDYFDVTPVGKFGSILESGYKVHILEGKHKGETIRVPTNYVQKL